jgi:hypothetical protein
MDVDGVFKTQKVLLGSLEHRVYDESDLKLLRLLKERADAQRHNARMLGRYNREHGGAAPMQADAFRHYAKWARENLVPEPALPNDHRLADYDESQHEESKALTRIINVMVKRHGWTRAASWAIDENERKKSVTITIKFE